MRKVEKEGFVLITFDEIDPFFGDDVGGVARNILHLGAVAPLFVNVVVTAAIEEADEFVEAVFGRVVFISVTEVPLSEHGGGIAVVLEDAGNGGDRGVEADLVTTSDDDIDDAVSLLVATGEEGGASGAADRGVGVEVGEVHPFPSHAVNAGSLHPTVVKTEVPAAEIVSEDDDDVGRAIFGKDREGE